MPGYAGCYMERQLPAVVGRVDACTVAQESVCSPDCLPSGSASEGRLPVRVLGVHVSSGSDEHVDRGGLVLVGGVVQCCVTPRVGGGDVRSALDEPLQDVYVSVHGGQVQR